MLVIALREDINTDRGIYYACLTIRTFSVKKLAGFMLKSLELYLTNAACKYKLKNKNNVTVNPYTNFEHPIEHIGCKYKFYIGVHILKL